MKLLSLGPPVESEIFRCEGGAWAPRTKVPHLFVRPSRYLGALAQVAAKVLTEYLLTESGFFAKIQKLTLRRPLLDNLAFSGDMTDTAPPLILMAF